MGKTLLAILTTGATICLGVLPAQTASINVLRGVEGEAVAVSPAARDIATVIRGRTEPAPGTADGSATTADKRRDLYLAAGSRVLWLVEPATGRLIACSLRGSSVAGQSRIHCTAGPSR